MIYSGDIQCISCGNLKDSIYYTIKYRNKSQGFHKDCNDCRRKKKLQDKQWKDGLLICKNCNTYKNPEDFHKCLKEKNRDGREYNCKKCEIKKKEIFKNKVKNDQHLDKVLNHRFNNLYNRCKNSKNSKFVIDFDEKHLHELWNIQKGICALSGVQMTAYLYNGKINTNVSIDRVDSSKGYTKDNVHLVCWVINQMKNDLSVHDLKVWCEKIINYNK